MTSEAADPTLPPDVPRPPKRYVRHRTRLVVTPNENQLELPWTPASEFEPDTLEPEREPNALEGVHLIEEFRPHPTAHELAKRAYPHAYDPEGPAGPALKLLNEIQELAQSMTEAYSDGDMVTVGSRLAVIAAVLGKVYPHTAFNPALGSAVSFLRRATLLAGADQCGFEELMGLAKAARRLAETPLMSLDDAAELILQLEAQGWVGADPDVKQFVTALFGEEEYAPAPDAKQDVKGAIE